MAPRKPAPPSSPSETTLTEINATDLSLLGAQLHPPAPTAPIRATPHDLRVATAVEIEAGPSKKRPRTPGYYESDEEGFPDDAAGGERAEDLGRGKRVRKPAATTGAGPVKKAVKKTTKRRAKKRGGPEGEDLSDDEDEDSEGEKLVKKPAKKSGKKTPAQEVGDGVSPATMRREIAGLVGQSLRVAVTFAQFLRDRGDVEDGQEEEAEQMERDVTTAIRNRKRKAEVREEEKVVKKRAPATRKR
ncbi:hypothetical protein P153DRAFT_356469 [Dothidotthia symphoricarpi CBS 119687]|uniref:Uncharacterized protein n=1 Tax=Dothidotthia symphoricarpi CBS 119687 TaxID=1392245 RepID=A0A6A6AD08_9PLEO|nr:uncharacterized protein P153DRAFT_356469 [Dothidotthia symphoricarpi CBS 119687]KAF2129782.1 hypothetical protein P153DRAFT_356469 [Dothidotthia symphoricarpi CBS 119687]